MSFSKAKLKRFNDIEISAGSPSTVSQATAQPSATISSTSSTASSSTAHMERKEQIEKFFKDAVRFASNHKEGKDTGSIQKEVKGKEKSKSKGLRLFRTPSLPHRLRFRQSSDVSTGNNVNSTSASSVPTIPLKEIPKSSNHLKGKEALQYEIRSKNELIENYISQIDVLKRHVEQLKENESKLCEENDCLSAKNDLIIKELTAENLVSKEINCNLTTENIKLGERCAHLEEELITQNKSHEETSHQLTAFNYDLKQSNEDLRCKLQEQVDENIRLNAQIDLLQTEISEARQNLMINEEKHFKHIELLENVRNTNCALSDDIAELKRRIEAEAHAYAQERKSTLAEMECLKNEKKSLKNDLASKCEFIRSLQEEILEKNCEIDAHCDTIRDLCREKSQFVNIESAEEKVRVAEIEAEQKLQKLESELEASIEREKSYWRTELEKQRTNAENELIKIELEKQDVMELLESTNDMLRERDEKIQKYEEQLRNGIDYYIQLTDNLQKQVVDLKQEIAKIITEKYNYQLTLSNTRSTVNILMERLKKSDSDVEMLKNDLESLQMTKSTLEQSYIALQTEFEATKVKLIDSEKALSALQQSSKTLQQEVLQKEQILKDMLSSEEETLGKLNKITSTFQERVDTDVTSFLEMFADLKNKNENRENYMNDMQKTLDEFANVLEFAQIELDNKEKNLAKVQAECEQLKLENISLNSKIAESNFATKCIAEKDTDEMLKIQNLRSECDEITSWLLSPSAEKSIRHESTNEIMDILKPSTPTGNIKSVTGKTTPSTPRAPRTPRITPKRTVLFTGKENLSPQRTNVLQTRNM